MLGRKRTRTDNENLHEQPTDQGWEVGMPKGLSRGVSGMETISSNAKELNYLASPYSLNGTADRGIMRQRYEQNARCSLKLTMQGLNVYSPVVYHHAIQEVCGYVDRPTNFWLELDFGILKLASGMFVLQLDEWQRSIGVKREIEFARENDIPVTFIHPDAYILTGKDDGKTN